MQMDSIRDNLLVMSKSVLWWKTKKKNILKCRLLKFLPRVILKREYGIVLIADYIHNIIMCLVQCITHSMQLQNISTRWSSWAYAYIKIAYLTVLLEVVCMMNESPRKYK